MGEFQIRLIKAMKMRDITQAELAQVTGMSKPRISQYVNGVYEAKQDALLKLAKALDVDVAWLMGYDVPMEAAPSAGNDAILDLLSRMTDAEKQELLDYMKYLISKRKDT